MNRRSDVAAVLCIAGPTLRRSFELPVKRAQSFDHRSNVPGLMIGTEYFIIENMCKFVLELKAFL